MSRAGMEMIMKWMIGLALLASVAAPAFAQDGGHHGGEGRGGGERGGDHGGNRPAPQGQPGQQAPHPQFQPPQRGPSPDQGARPQYQPHGGDRGAGGGFGGPGRMPPGGQPGGTPAGVQVHRGDVRQPGGPGGWHGGRPDQGPGGPRAGWTGGGRPDWQGGRPDHGPADHGPGWSGNRPRFAGRPGGDPRTGGWNRGWRDDHRYDWRGWRDTHRSFYHVGGYRPPYGYGWGYRRFDVGVRIDPVFFAQDYWISDPWYYRLPPAEGPYRWVRYYNDALLIDVYSGMVVDAIPDFFW
jgi:Ni/Co efflux regulator RcnB